MEGGLRQGGQDFFWPPAGWGRVITLITCKHTEGLQSSALWALLIFWSKEGEKFQVHRKGGQKNSDALLGGN